MPIDMGLGRIGEKNIVFKRKFRWTFTVFDICPDFDTLEPSFVKLASRPNISFEETEINFLNGKTWIPGKGTWETITVTYIDAAVDDMRPLYKWLAAVYEFNDPTRLRMGSRASWAATGILTMYDGCGDEIEEWQMGNMWPQAINFGDLDYAASDEVTIELTLRYSDVRYTNFCPGFSFESCCQGCVASVTG